MPRRMLAVLLALLATSLCAFADSVLWQLAPGGTYTLSGSELTTAIGVPVLALKVKGSEPNDNAPYVLTDGLLTISSGSYDPSDSAPRLGIYTWDAPTITVTGCIPGVTSTGQGGACTSADDQATLFTVDAVHIAISFPLNEIVTGNLTGSLPDAQFDQFFGIDSSILGGQFKGELSDLFAATAKHSVTVPSGPGGIHTNASAMSTVPEDWGFASTLALFAFALAVFGLAGRLGLLKAVVF